MATADYDRVRDHLDSCSTCADELAALSAFDFQRLEDSAPMTAGRAVRKLSGSLKGLRDSLLGREARAPFSFPKLG